MYKVITFICCFLISTMSYAKDAEYCSIVRFAEAGSTDNSVTTSMISVILEEVLSYKTNIKLLALPVILKSLKIKGIDVYTGYWSPSNDQLVLPYVMDGSVQIVSENLRGAKYMLAVNDIGFQIGIKSYQDIARYKKELKGKIYGIDPGHSGNQRILDMIEHDKFSLKDFRLVESSEHAMFYQVKRNQQQNMPIVFLSWDPHPINFEMKLHYLSGGEEISGFGEASVHTIVSAGYMEKCPNIGRLLKNIKFSLAMESEMMEKILKNKEDPKLVGRNFLRANPRILKEWLIGVTNFDGKHPDQEFEKFVRN
ncbi:MAG: glycine/betaine ABC transporter substrate-binding protein [Candidatus Liberibacter ctenarytainae]|uniref:Glycine/betaine ABC transporter substrate-binding protein n=1 Tax=Candidatus Liberibacter ctenarytainae TaxID=2020335 RepID=A0A937DLG7_9HYPH|nr:glycine/betaine ABC transporter substrate-binding protein [Candidatus Liberibacter ctenarytainae]